MTRSSGSRLRELMESVTPQVTRDRPTGRDDRESGLHMHASLARIRRVTAHGFEPLVALPVVTVLHQMGLGGRSPLWLVNALVLLAIVCQQPGVQRWLAGGDLQRRLWARLGVHLGLATVAGYVLGWGAVLATSYVVIVAVHLRWSGSAVWRAAAVWTAAGMAGGQTAIAFGWVDSYIPVPRAHAVALMTGLAAVMIIRLLGQTTQQREHESAERERAEVALRQREHRFRALVHSSTDVITVADPTGRITYVSPAAERVMGYQPHELIGRDGMELVHPDDLAGAKAILATIMVDSTGECRAELRLRHADGSWHWHEVTVRNLLGEPAVGGIVGNHRDVSERRAYQERLTWQASHDSLTGLANRTTFLERLTDALARARRHQHTLAVLFVDLDGFKQVNDTLGHHSGDLVLREVTARLLGCVRQPDLVARLAGDEFTVLLEDLVDVDEAQVVVERVEAMLAEPIVLADEQVRVTASVGVAVSAVGKEVADDLLRDADLAMYQRKRARSTARSNVPAHPG
jgi:diguanylate cyclase (GGDEF)-like protein/PAS domain S-box-containing protein